MFVLFRFTASDYTFDIFNFSVIYFIQYVQRQGLGLWHLTPTALFLAIQWRSVLLVEKTRVPGENHPPTTSH